eukprot:3030140-Amphidinium_carterae.1
MSVSSPDSHGKLPGFSSILQKNEGPSVGELGAETLVMRRLGRTLGRLHRYLRSTREFEMRGLRVHITDALDRHSFFSGHRWSAYLRDAAWREDALKTVIAGVQDEIAHLQQHQRDLRPASWKH